MDVTGKPRAAAWLVLVLVLYRWRERTDSQGMDHSFESHIDFSTSNDLGDVYADINNCNDTKTKIEETYHLGHLARVEPL